MNWNYIALITLLRAAYVVKHTFRLFYKCSDFGYSLYLLK